MSRIFSLFLLFVGIVHCYSDEDKEQYNYDVFPPSNDTESINVLDDLHNYRENLLEIFTEIEADDNMENMHRSKRKIKVRKPKNLTELFKFHAFKTLLTVRKSLQDPSIAPADTLPDDTTDYADQVTSDYYKMLANYDNYVGMKTALIDSRLLTRTLNSVNLDEYTMKNFIKPKYWDEKKRRQDETKEIKDIKLYVRQMNIEKAVWQWENVMKTQKLSSYKNCHRNFLNSFIRGCSLHCRRWITDSGDSIKTVCRSKQIDGMANFRQCREMTSESKRLGLKNHPVVYTGKKCEVMTELYQECYGNMFLRKITCQIFCKTFNNRRNLFKGFSKPKHFSTLFRNTIQARIALTSYRAYEYQCCREGCRTEEIFLDEFSCIVCAFFGLWPESESEATPNSVCVCGEGNCLTLMAQSVSESRKRRANSHSSPIISKFSRTETLSSINNCKYEINDVYDPMTIPEQIGKDLHKNNDKSEKRTTTTTTSTSTKITTVTTPAILSSNRNSQIFSSKNFQQPQHRCYHYLSPSNLLAKSSTSNHQLKSTSPEEDLSPHKRNNSSSSSTDDSASSLDIGVSSVASTTSSTSTGNSSTEQLCKQLQATSLMLTQKKESSSSPQQQRSTLSDDDLSNGTKIHLKNNDHSKKSSKKSSHLPTTSNRKRKIDLNYDDNEPKKFHSAFDEVNRLCSSLNIVLHPPLQPDDNQSMQSGISGDQIDIEPNLMNDDGIYVPQFGMEADYDSESEDEEIIDSQFISKLFNHHKVTL
ncbi:hypothetical protein SNEBB_005711 [Seison nebaliae]|nr:hypothetical protein SNEBB_005711 [Seison nebaliae]